MVYISFVMLRHGLYDQKGMELILTLCTHILCGVKNGDEMSKVILTLTYLNDLRMSWKKQEVIIKYDLQIKHSRAVVVYGVHVVYNWWEFTDNLIVTSN